MQVYSNQYVCVHARSCPTPWDPTGYSILCPWDSPGKNNGVHAIFSSRGSSGSRDQTLISFVSCTGRLVDSLPLVPFELKSNCWQGWFILETMKGKSVSLCFSAISSCPYSLVYGPFLQLQSNLFPSLYNLLVQLLLCPCDYTQPTRIISSPWDPLPDHICKVPTYKIKWGLFQRCKAPSIFFFNVIYHINRLKKKITWSYQYMQKKHLTKFNTHSS